MTFFKRTFSPIRGESGGFSLKENKDKNGKKEIETETLFFIFSIFLYITTYEPMIH